MSISKIERELSDKEIRIQTEEDVEILGYVLPNLESELDNRISSWPADTKFISACFRRGFYVHDGLESDKLIYYNDKINRSGVLPIECVIGEGRSISHMARDRKTGLAIVSTDVILLEDWRMKVAVDLNTIFLRTKRALVELGKTEVAKVINYEEGLRITQVAKSRKRSVTDTLGVLATQTELSSVYFEGRREKVLDDLRRIR